MPEERFYLNRRDRNLLDRLHRMFVHERENAPSASINEEILDNTHQAPEVYIALVPEGGIPALEPSVGTGSAGFTAGDRPGSAECTLYRVINGQLVYIRKSQVIYNLTETEITQRWISVKRDKFGTWLADTGGSGTPCESRNEVWMIKIDGSPASGDFSIEFGINSIFEEISIPYNASTTDVESAFLTHSELVSGDVLVEGGPLPGTSVRVTFTGAQAGTEIPLVSFSVGTLSNFAGTGSGTDQAGIGVAILRWTPGYSP